MEYNNSKEAVELFQQFLTVKGSWQHYLCFAGNGGYYALRRAGDYKDKGQSAELSIRGNDFTLSIYDKETGRSKNRTLFLRNNVANKYRQKIVDYCDCINGYKDWDELGGANQ